MAENKELIGLEFDWKKIAKSIKQEEELKKMFYTARLTGEFLGFLKAMLLYNLPKEVKTKIKNKIKELER